MPIRKTEGYCPCCCQQTEFVSENYWLRDYYICSKCGSIPRQRALMKVLRGLYPDLKKVRIHESSPSKEMAAQFRRETDLYACSYFVENLPLGADLGNGATNENLEQLTLPDHSVDVFITQDVLEHVYNPQKAFQEIERVLSVGGVHLFTTPIRLFAKTQPRGYFDGKKWINILPPVYHGNPISEQGSLVTYDWGVDIADIVDRATYHSKTEIIQFLQTEENYRYGLEADYLQVILSRKY